MMLLIVLLILIVQSQSFSLYNTTNSNNVKDGELMYILATTWTPEFCYNEVIIFIIKTIIIIIIIINLYYIDNMAWLC